MNIPAERIAALQSLGYSERESRFLYIVATHSGYFLQRQYQSFRGAKGKGKVSALVAKVLRAGHVQEQPYGDSNGKLYHLFARPLYAAIGKQDSKNRRPGDLLKANAKLLALDFVLAHLDGHYLEEEPSRIHFFTKLKKLSLDLLPRRTYFSRDGKRSTTHFFVDKFPLFLSQPDKNAPPLVTFSYIEDGSTMQGFLSHLAGYSPLLTALTDPFRFVYVAAKRDHFPAAEHYFYRLLSRPIAGPKMDELRRYFQLRKGWEARNFQGFSEDDFSFRAEGERKFQGAFYHQLFRHWLEYGDRVFSDTVLQTNLAEKRLGQFETFLIPPGGRLGGRQ